MVEQNLRLNWLARVWYRTMKNSQKLNRRPTIENKATRSHKRSHIMHNSEKRLDNNSCFINKSWSHKINLMNSVNIDSRIYLNARAGSSGLKSCSFWDATDHRSYKCDAQDPFSVIKKFEEPWVSGQNSWMPTKRTWFNPSSFQPFLLVLGISGSREKWETVDLNLLFVSSL